MKKANLLKVLPLLLCPALIQAEIVTDGSLGVETSLAGPDFTIGADLGQQHGSNLFHSFSQFNIANGESATFSGPANIANIISRITGGSQSTIDGLLRSDITGANVFLLNPAGVIFGPNASLDISGSLHVSTGNSLIFENMEEFLATPLTGEVLSTAAPKAFGFLGGANGSIEINGAELTLASESTLGLAAGDIKMDQANITIEQGRVLLTATNQANEVSVDDGQLADGVTSTAGTITIDQSEIMVDGEGGGYISSHSQQLIFQDSILSASTEGSLSGQGVDIAVSGSFNMIDSTIDTSTNAFGDAGFITINATQLLTMEGNSQISSDAEAEASGGTAGTIFVTTKRLELNDASKISSDNKGFFSDEFSFNFGGIDVDVDELIMYGNSQISSNTSGSGDAGFITINATELLKMGGNSQISSDSEAGALGGTAGTITVSAKRLELSDSSKISSDNKGLFSGEFSFNFGGIDIDVDELIMYGNSHISSNTSGSGDAGFITINATELLMMRDNSSISSSTSGSGDAGFIDIESTDLTMEGDSQINNNTSGAGNGGITTVTVTNLSIDGANGTADKDTGIFSDVKEESTGDFGGFISIDAQETVEIRNGGQIGASTFGDGFGGAIFVNAKNLLIDAANSAAGAGTGIFSDVKEGSTGDFGGFILVDAQETVELRDGGQISVSTFEEGDAGEVTVKASEKLTLSGGARVLSESNSSADNSGNAGKVTLEAPQLTIGGNSIVSSDTFGKGNAGEIVVKSTESMILKDNSNIYSDSNTGATGDAGSVTIDASELIMEDYSTIRSDTYGEGDGGTVIIKASKILKLNDNSKIFSSSRLKYDDNSGDAGDISIDAFELVMEGDSEISSNTFGEANAGTITLNSKFFTLGDNSIVSSDSGDQNDIVLLDDMLFFRSNSGLGGLIDIDATELIMRDNSKISSLTLGAGAAGNIDIDSAELIMMDDSTIINDTVFGAGDAGTITIKASRRLELNGKSNIFSDSNPAATGDAGNIIIDATELIMRDSSLITSDTYGAGAAGNVNIHVKDILVDGATISSSSQTELPPDSGLEDFFFPNLGDGAAGNVTLVIKGAMGLENNARIASSGSGSGNAGSVAILTEGSMNLDNASIQSANSGTGSAGTVGLYAVNNVADFFTDDGLIDALKLSSVTLDELNGAGSISLFNGSAVSTQTVDGFDPDNPASIKVAASNLLLDSGSTITTDATGEAGANAGEINLKIAESIVLLDQSKLSTESASGGGGSIEVITRDLLYLQDSSITTNVGLGGGNGGDIFVDPIFIALNNSEITANAVDGNGGNITLIADYIQQSTDSLITATSKLGIDGEINIEALDVDVDTGEDNLTADFLDASQWAKQACTQVSGSGVSSFVVSRRPLRPSPNAVWSASPMD